MRLYVLEGVIDYEPSYILGVYDSLDRALQAARDHQMSDSERNMASVNGYAVRERELNADPDLYLSEIDDYVLPAGRG